jgi:hypothetical protein
VILRPSLNNAAGLDNALADFLMLPGGRSDDALSQAGQVFKNWDTYGMKCPGRAIRDILITENVPQGEREADLPKICFADSRMWKNVRLRMGNLIMGISNRMQRETVQGSLKTILSRLAHNLGAMIELESLVAKHPEGYEGYQTSTNVMLDHCPQKSRCIPDRLNQIRNRMKQSGFDQLEIF